MSAEKMLVLLFAVIFGSMVVTASADYHYKSKNIIACYEAAKVNTNIKCEENKK